MLTLPSHLELLQPADGAACSNSREGLWWSILKIEKFCLTARLDASPAVGGVPQGPRQHRACSMMRRTVSTGMMYGRQEH